MAARLASPGKAARISRTLHWDKKVTQSKSVNYSVKYRLHLCPAQYEHIVLYSATEVSTLEEEEEEEEEDEVEEDNDDDVDDDDGHDDDDDDDDEEEE